MKIYNKTSVQNIPISLEEAWSFFSNPKNLKIITPEYMGFVIKSGAEKQLFAGQLIEYVVTPLFSIKTQWVSEITQVKHQDYFVDKQIAGPYTMWHHKHFFRSIPGGVAVEDSVDYVVPLGIIGQLVHPFLVKPKIEEIFNYRTAKLLELFGEFKG
jgi:ligand-binding SRPBCC domain-containing protein